MPTIRQLRTCLSPLAAGAAILLAACAAPGMPQARAIAAAQGAGSLHAAGFTGDIQVHHAVASRFLSQKRDVWVYLPPGYEDAANAGVRYPVLYMHDGNNVFDGSQAFGGHEWGADETAEQLIRAGSVTPLIIVGVGNTPDRTEEYTWVSGSIDGKAVGGKGQAYAKFLVQELKPFIDKTYRTKPGRTDTGIIGSSLGGLMDIYLARYDADTFGKVGIMSPSVWWDDRAVLAEVPKIPTTMRIWLDMGRQEGSTPEEELANARELEKDLVADGYQEGKNLAYFEDPIGGHNEQAWAYRFPMALKFLYGTDLARKAH